jgi:hypothetical protein
MSILQQKHELNDGNDNGDVTVSRKGAYGHVQYSCQQWLIPSKEKARR